MKAPRNAGGRPPMPMPLEMLAETLYLTRALLPRVAGPILSLSLLLAALFLILAFGTGMIISAQHFLVITVMSLVFEAAVFRLVLLNEDLPPMGLRLGRRELRFIGYYVTVVLLSFMVMSMLRMVIGGLSSSGGVGVILFHLGLAFFVFLYLFLRLLPGLVATALDSPEPLIGNMRQSWELSRNRVATIFSATLILVLPALVLSEVLSLPAGGLVQLTGARLLGLIPAAMVFFFVELVLSILRAVYYRRIGGWVPEE